MKRFFKDLKENATKIINNKKKEMIPLTDKEKKSYKKQNFVTHAKSNLILMMATIKNHKVRDHCHYTGKFRGAAHSICTLGYKTPKEIPVVFLNGSTYDYHFIIKQLAKEFDGQFECLGENSEKYITFSVPISKELDNGKKITYKLKFIDSFRLMSSKLTDLVDNFSEIYCKECTGCKKKKRIKSMFDFFFDLKIINCITNAKNVKIDG